MSFDPSTTQQDFLLFNNEANFALLDTSPGAENGNGLYQQLVYGFNNVPYGWNDYFPITGFNHNDWAAGGGGSDTLVGDTAGDLSDQANYMGDGQSTMIGESPSNDILYGGGGTRLDLDDMIQAVIDARGPLNDDGEDSTPPPFDDFDFGDFDVLDFDLNTYNFTGLNPILQDYAGDWLVGGRDNDTLFGQLGNDTLEGGEGSDWMFGGRDNDVMDGHYLQTGIDGWAVEGDNLAYYQTSSDAGDVMFGERGNDTMFGGDDDMGAPLTLGDVLAKGLPEGLPDGTTVLDLYVRTGEGGCVPVTQDICGDFEMQDAVVLYKDSFTGTGGQACYVCHPIWFWDGDWMTGQDGRDWMHGEAGFDTMYGGVCRDTMYGGDHYDLMYGGLGSDLMFGGNDDTDNGGEENGGDHADPKGYCEDRCAYEGNYDPAWPNNGDLQYRGGDTMYGGRGHDTMYGGAGDDLMFGGQGLDLMYGGDDDDRMLGEVGNDEMYGGNGWDDMDGGRGDDQMFGGEGNDWMKGGYGNDSMQGEAGDDVMHGENGDDVMSGGEGNDTMYGGLGRDAMDGDAGDDCMHGDAGRDTMRGGEGDDKIAGGANADVIYGDAGDDIIWIEGGEPTEYELVWGGEGNDTFVYNFELMSYYDELPPTVEFSDAMNGDADFVPGAVGTSGWVYIGDFEQSTFGENGWEGGDVLQLCFDDPVMFCCDTIDHEDLPEELSVYDSKYFGNNQGMDPSQFDYWNVSLMQALSEKDTDGNHAVQVIDNGEYTMIRFDSTFYAPFQDGKAPEGEDAFEPQPFMDAVILLDGVTGGVGSEFLDLEDLHNGGYRIEIKHPEYMDFAKIYKEYPEDPCCDFEGQDPLDDNTWGEGNWTYVACEIDCGCEADPFGPFATS